MRTLTDVEAQSILEPFLDDLWTIVDLAWSRFWASPHRADLSHPTVRANVLWGLMVSEAQRRFAGSRMRAVTNVGEFRTFIVHSEVDGSELLEVRLKKLDPGGRSSNYATDRARHYNAQLEFPTIEYAVPRVDVGYVLNATQTGIASVLVAHRDGEDVAWTFAVPEQTARVVDLTERRSLTEERRGARVLAADQSAREEQDHAQGLREDV